MLRWQKQPSISWRDLACQGLHLELMESLHHSKRRPATVRRERWSKTFGAEKWSMLSTFRPLETTKGSCWTWTLIGRELTMMPGSGTIHQWSLWLSGNGSICLQVIQHIRSVKTSSHHTGTPSLCVSPWRQGSTGSFTDSAQFAQKTCSVSGREGVLWHTCCAAVTTEPGRLCIRVQWFFKFTMLHVVLDRQKISKTVLEKAFFFILWCFYLFSTFVLINFKIGPSERWKFFFLK